MPHRKLPCMSFAVLLFLLFFLSLPALAQAAAGKPNTLFLPLKTKSLQGDNFNQQLDQVLKEAAQAQDQEFYPRPEATERLDYQGIWPPSYAKISAFAAGLGYDYIVTGSATKLGDTIAIDLILFDLLEKKSQPFTFGQATESTLPATMHSLAQEITAFTERHQRIAAINIKGNSRIDSGAILRHIQNRAGDEYNPARLQEDLRAIFKMGYFDDITLDVRGSDKGKEVTFIVDEKEIIAKVEIKGAKEINEDDIKEVLTVTANTIYSPQQVNKSADLIRALYKSKGYYNTRVTTKLTYPKDDYITIEFDIVEGKKVYIKEINFLGNQTFSDSELLDIMITSEKGWLSWFTESGVLKRDSAKEDANRIGAYYQNHGFVDVKIGEPVITKKDEWLYITFHIEEGERYKVGIFDIQGDLLDDKEKLLARTNLGDERYFTREVLRDDTLALAEFYSSKGYAFADIAPETKKDAANKRVDVILHIDKGELVHVNRILIKGNDRTRDKVIRREMALNEEDIYDASAIKASTARLKRLDFFEDVSITPEATEEENKMNLVVDVKEKATGTFSIGAGYSSVDNLMFMAEVKQDNFMGRGQQVSLQANIGGTNTRYNLKFTEPHLNDSKLLVGFDIYSWEHDYDDYTKDSTGGALRFGYPLWWRWHAYASVGMDNSKLSDLSDYAAQIIIDSQYIETSRFVTFGVARDTRNRRYLPSTGARHAISTKKAGSFLGGDSEFTKTEASTSWYFPVFSKLVFHAKVAAGYINEDDPGDGTPENPSKLPVYERFYLGGLSTVRGFENGKISPVDTATDERIGGTEMAYMNLEFTFPLFEDAGLSGVIFYDAGQVWDRTYKADPDEYYYRSSYEEFADNWDPSTLRHGAGFGFRWLSPMGPLRLEWGKNLDPRDDEDSSIWDFSIGGSF
ncbi:MAG: outer membrane protein assembly factor BamA [Desulfurivibrionaceae bacterium]|nr:outer membrane protein assembly factor BamA [Desulfurivibrionaceae bacterium]